VRAPQCSYCPRRFLNTSNLIVHQRVHTGEKMFACELCPKKFTRNAHLTKHVQAEHAHAHAAPAAAALDELRAGAEVHAQPQDHAGLVHQQQQHQFQLQQQHLQQHQQHQQHQQQQPFSGLEAAADAANAAAAAAADSAAAGGGGGEGVQQPFSGLGMGSFPPLASPIAPHYRHLSTNSLPVGSTGLPLSVAGGINMFAPMQSPLFSPMLSPAHMQARSARGGGGPSRFFSFSLGQQQQQQSQPQQHSQQHQQQQQQQQEPLTAASFQPLPSEPSSAQPNGSP
jgi:uncharacterized C2H2 Zn-finger protein